MIDYHNAFITDISAYFKVCILSFVLIVGCIHGPDSALGLVEAQSLSVKDADPLGPEGQAALQAILETGNLSDLRWPDFSDYREDVIKFYNGYGGALPWMRGMRATPQAQAMIRLFQTAFEKGLSADDYNGSRWAVQLAGLRPAAGNPKESDLVRFDVALTVSAMRYISDLHIGRVKPQRLNFGMGVPERKFNSLPDFLREQVVQASDISAILQQVEPPYPGYRRTLEALKRYREIARKSHGENFPSVKKPVKPGQTYSGLSRVARLLRLLGDLPKNIAIKPGSTVYQGGLVKAVKNFQQRHGLARTGQIDAQTIAALNIPLSRRVRQIELTLERWRWLPDEYLHSPIVVNIPEFRLRAYDDQFKVAVTMKVMVGRAYEHDTPIFMNKMRHAIFRPYWNVPPSIAKTDIVPSLEQNPFYLAKEDMEVVDYRENVVPSGVVTDRMLQKIREGKLLIRQRPGPKNSLGLIKFMFPNEYDVYMHDTPETELFAKSRRDFSHGCIRLEKPVDLAVWVLRGNPGWDADRIRAAMNGSNTEEVTLVSPIPVLIVYGTVIVSEDGTVNFYEDIYKHDAALEQALAKGYPYPR